jgi:hypothetical protein
MTLSVVNQHGSIGAHHKHMHAQCLEPCNWNVNGDVDISSMSQTLKEEEIGDVGNSVGDKLSTT